MVAACLQVTEPGLQTNLLLFKSPLLRQWVFLCSYVCVCLLQVSYLIALELLQLCYETAACLFVIPLSPVIRGS